MHPSNICHCFFITCALVLIPVSSTVIPIIEDYTEQSQWLALSSVRHSEKKQQKKKKPEKSIWQLKLY